jgi:hypothetical protein
MSSYGCETSNKLCVVALFVHGFRRRILKFTKLACGRILF